MRVMPLSDLHLEFLIPNHFRMLETIPSRSADVLILAGDILVFSAFDEGEAREIFMEFARKAKRTLFIPGNHSYYGTDPRVLDRFLERELPKWGIDLLGPHADRILKISGREFLGCTLWFPDQADNHVFEKHLTDFGIIQNFKPWVYDTWATSENFLKTYVDKDQVVVTHHLPTPKSIHPKYKDDGLNRFFLGDVESTIVEQKPALWIHGHTHSSFDYRLGETRIVCNPLGYPQEGNREFDPAKVIELKGAYIDGKA